MAFSNKFGELVLTTGNKSEIGVGYCTLYGDMVGGLGVIADVPRPWCTAEPLFEWDQAGDPAIDHGQGPIRGAAARPEGL